MRKYKLELFIIAIFASLITLLMWDSISIANRYAPVILLVIFITLIVISILPFKDKDGKYIEKYASKYFSMYITTCLILIIIFILSAVLLNKNNFSYTFDTTSNKINSLSNETTKFIDTLNKNVQIICIPSSDPISNYCDKYSDLISLYSKRSKFIIYSGVVNLSNKTLLSKIQPSGFSRLILMTNDNKSELDGKINENSLTNGIINLIRFKKTVYFLTGNGEPMINAGENNRNYADIVNILQNKSYDVKEWDVKKGSLPADAKLLVAGDNLIPYNSNVESLITEFLGHGGKVILIINPYREQGLSKLYQSLSLSLPPVLLTLNVSTSLGQQISKQDLIRPPVIASNFSFDSPITKIIAESYGAQAVMPVDGGRPIYALNSTNNTLMKTNSTILISAYDAAPITLTDKQRNNINLAAPFTLKADKSFDKRKTWPLALDIKITGAQNLLSTKTDNKKSANINTELVVYGFSIVGPYSNMAPISDHLIPLSVAHLYQDKELVSIPPRDFVPKQFNLSRNPNAWLPFFAGILPILTAIIGIFVWVRRRHA